MTCFMLGRKREKLLVLVLYNFPFGAAVDRTHEDGSLISLCDCILGFAMSAENYQKKELISLMSTGANKRESVSLLCRCS